MYKGFLSVEKTKNRVISQTLLSLGVIFVLLLGGALYFTGDKILFQGTKPVAQRLVIPPEMLAALQGGDLAVEPPPAPEPPKVPQVTGTPFDPASITAKAVLLKDTETGTVLHAQDEYVQRPLASITKLMSALVVLEKEPDWTATTSVVADDLIDTHMYAGDTYTADELWRAALIGSSNKAIMTLADFVGWEREAFVARMNERAQELGMGDSYFTEPTGLDEGNVGSASDVLILLSEALRHPKLQQALLEKELDLYSEEREKAHHMWTTNWLMLGWIPNTFSEHLGGKTGFIGASGYNFTTRVVTEDGHELDVVILGSENHEGRFLDARTVLDWAGASVRWPEENLQEETPA